MDMIQKNGDSSLESTDLAHRVVELVADKKAADIILLDLRSLTPVTDYFVICTAESNRQIGAIVDGLRDDLRDVGLRPLHIEGAGDSGWVLVDYGEVVIHVFSPEDREYYRLEKAWSAAPVVLRMQ
jgi:ribosome-associated protein